MYHAHFHTKLIIFDIFNQLKHIPSQTLVAQLVHPLTYQIRHATIDFLILK